MNPRTPNPVDLLAIGEVARILGVSTARVRQLEAKGRLSSRRISGWRVFDRETVLALAEERAVRANGPSA